MAWINNLGVDRLRETVMLRRLIDDALAAEEKQDPAVTTNAWEHLELELTILELRLRRYLTDRPVADEQRTDHLTFLPSTRAVIESLHEAGQEDRSSERLEREIDRLETELADIRRVRTSAGTPAPLDVLRALFNLDRLAELCLLCCLAPEIDPKYQRVYQLINEDHERPGATLTLIANVLGQQYDSAEVWSRFAQNSPLHSARLVHSDRDAFLGTAQLRLDRTVVQYMLNPEGVDDEVLDILSARQNPDEIICQGLISSCDLLTTQIRAFEAHPTDNLVVQIIAPSVDDGAAIVTMACATAGVSVLGIDLHKLTTNPEAEDLIRRALLTGFLRGFAVRVDGCDTLNQDSPQAQLVRDTLFTWLQRFTRLSFLITSDKFRYSAPPIATRRYEIHIQNPDALERRTIWLDCLRANNWLTSENQSGVAERLAGKFTLSRTQIGEVLHQLKDEDDAGQAELDEASINSACRASTTHGLAELATRVQPRFGFGDIVLPPDQMSQLRELQTHVEQRLKVLDLWGLRDKFSSTGTTALFSGSSGTGKTMAAEALAQELNIELYKIDLSRVISKYIGETEKHLGTIFETAEHSNAILFFDECDALFGKRSEVKEAHDRYANIEVSYLLQRMEEYRGIAILATNLKRNLDEAFVRRLRFEIQFPLPDESLRQEIWAKALPNNRVTIGADVDWRFLAARLPISGGAIKNIAFVAAHLAASEGNVISMRHFLRASRRELQKMGRQFTPDEFAPFGAFIEAVGQ